MFETYFKDYLKDFAQTSKSVWSCEAGVVLLAAKEMYEATGVADYYRSIVEYMDSYIAEDGTLINLNEESQDVYEMGLGKILCFLYEQDAKEKYKKALDVLVARIRAMEDNYEALPLYLEFETKFNEKENYNDVYRCMKNSREYFEDNAVSLECRAYDLMALIDMYENSSEEVFEQHKQYSVWFKEALKPVMAREQKGIKETAIIAYCILKGCRLGVLLQEKYQQMAEDMVCQLCDLEFAEVVAADGAGAVAMAWAEYLRRKELL